MKKLLLSLLICFVLIICCCCGSPSKNEETTPEETTGQAETEEDKTGAHTERYDNDNGDYTIYDYDENGFLVHSSTYSEDGTLKSDSTFEKNDLRRETETYVLSYMQDTGRKIETWVTYLYTDGSPMVKAQWKRITYVEDDDTFPAGEYTGTAEVEYQMQEPNNGIKFSIAVSGYDTDNFLLVPREYSVLEKNKNGVVSSEQFKYEEAKSEDGTDAASQDEDGYVLAGTVAAINYDEAVELQGYPDYNEADKGQTWVIVKLDAPQRLKGTQDVDTWEKEYSVILVWTHRSSGTEYGETTLSDYIGKHISFTAGSFSRASDTSVPIGVPWAHDISVIDSD